VSLGALPRAKRFSIAFYRRVDLLPRTRTIVEAGNIPFVEFGVQTLFKISAYEFWFGVTAARPPTLRKSNASAITVASIQDSPVSRS
jgi:hypothetical protein